MEILRNPQTQQRDHWRRVVPVHIPGESILNNTCRHIKCRISHNRSFSPHPSGCDAPQQARRVSFLLQHSGDINRVHTFSTSNLKILHRLLLRRDSPYTSGGQRWNMKSSSFSPYMSSCKTSHTRRCIESNKLEGNHAYIQYSNRFIASCQQYG